MKKLFCTLCVLVSWSAVAATLDCAYARLHPSEEAFVDRFTLERDRPAWSQNFRTHGYEVAWAKDVLSVSAHSEGEKASGKVALKDAWDKSREKKRVEQRLLVGNHTVIVACQ